MNLGNFLISNNFEIKICDFGKSRQFDSTSELTCEVGSPFFRAPECELEWYAHSGDIWSFALITMKLLEAGSDPILDYSPEAIDQKHWFEDEHVLLEAEYVNWATTVGLPKVKEYAGKREKCIGSVWDSLKEFRPILEECLSWKPSRRPTFFVLSKKIYNIQKEQNLSSLRMLPSLFFKK